MTIGRIVAPHFVAGFEIVDRKVGRWCAPIIRYMVGWDGRKVGDYCKRKGWELQVLTCPNLPAKRPINS